MKKKLMVLAMALGLSVAALTGCSKPTVESLIDDMYEKEIDSMTAEMDMDIVLTIKMNNVSMDVSVGGNIEMQASGLTSDGEMALYMDGDVDMTTPGGSNDVGFALYMQMDDDTYVAYVYDETTDTWYTAETDADEIADAMDEAFSEEMQDASKEMNENMRSILKENGELAEDTEDVEGEECYVITATIDGKDFVSILEPMEDMLDDVMEDAGLDFDLLSWFKYCSMDVTYYISKDTGYLVSSEIDMADWDIYGMMVKIIADTGLDVYIDLEDMLDDISFSTCKFTCVMSDINDTEVKIPRDVINNAVSMDEAGMIDDIIGDVTYGGYDYDDYDYDYDDYDWDDDDDDDSVTDSEWYDDDSFIFYKDFESDEFLCEVNVPDGYSYDYEFLNPEYGLVCLDSDDGGWIWVQNYLSGSTYYALLNDGVLPDDYSEYEKYEDYQMVTGVIGTAFGGSDIILVAEMYTYVDDEWDLDYDVENVYLCIEYDDGGYREFLSVDLSNLDSIYDWNQNDFVTLARELFGR